MAGTDHDYTLSTAVRAVRELMEKRLASDSDETSHAIRVGLEELNVLWEELLGQTDHLARERQRYLEFFDHAPDAYLITDTDGNIREANRAAALLLHASQQYLATKPLAALLTPEARRVFRANLIGLNLGVATPSTWRSGVRTPNGETRAIAVTVRAIGASSGGPPGFCWLLRPDA